MKKTLVAVSAALALAVPSAASAVGVYFVKQGDSLYRVSRLFGLTVDELKTANRLTSNAIKPGMRLTLPEKSDASWATPTDRSASAPVPPEVGQAVGTILTPSAASPFGLPERALPVCGDEVVTHTIRKGDTLSAIARNYGVPLKDLLALNDIGSATRLRIGREITVKSSGPREYTVRKGDNLWSITRRYDIGLDDLKRLNGLSGSALKPGQKLVLQACRLLADGEIRETAVSRYLDDAFADMLAVASGNITFEEVMAADAEPPGIVRRMVDFAQDLLNIPYRFGGTSFRGIDCSAYVQKVFAFLSIPLPRTAREQFKVGEVIGRDDLEVGDLVFFRTYARYASHVGIYLGDNHFIHASSRARKVAIDRFDQPYYAKRFLGARRMIDRTGEAVVRLATNGL